MSAPSVTTVAGLPTAEASSGTSDLSRRFERLVPLVLVFCVFLAAVLCITPWPVGAYEDDAIYTLLAKALATGEGYRMINLPGAPGATHYPPGYPFLLSLLWRLSPGFPDNVVVFKFANAVLLAVAAGGAYWFARGRLGYGALSAALIAMAGIGSMTMLQLAGFVLSEPLFIVVLFLALPIVERCAREGSVRDAAIAGVVLGVLFMVRTIGVVAIGATLLVLLWRRHLRAAAMIAAVSALFLVPWQVWVGAHESALAPILQGKYGPYGSWLVDGYREGGIDFARRVILKNFAGVGNTLSYLVMPVQPGVLRRISLLMLVPMVLAGLVLAAKRAPVLVTFCVAYLALIIVWPFHPYRFLLALWPVLVIAVAAVIRVLWTWRPRGSLMAALRFATLGMVGYLAAGHLAYNWVEFREGEWRYLQEGAGESAKPLVEWVARYTNADDVLSTDHELVVYLYTGRRGVPTTTFLASQRLKRFTAADYEHWMGIMVETFQPRYVITGWPPHVTAADSLSTGASPVLRRLGTIPSHTIYERVVR